MRISGQNNESGGWASLLPVCCILVLGAAGIAGGINAGVSRVLTPHLGDLLKVRAATDPGRGNAFSVEARRADGTTCTIGTGDSAETGGSVMVVRRDADGSVGVQWAGRGRSAAKGSDCGNGAELTLTENQFSDLRSAIHSLPGQDPYSQVPFAP